MIIIDKTSFFPLLVHVQLPVSDFLKQPFHEPLKIVNLEFHENEITQCPEPDIRLWVMVEKLYHQFGGQTHSTGEILFIMSFVTLFTQRNSLIITIGLTQSIATTQDVLEHGIETQPPEFRAILGNRLKTLLIETEMSQMEIVLLSVRQR